MPSSDESKYAQQHLANERTFLAWIRTSLAIVGLGFVAAGIVFRSTPKEHAGHALSAVAGIGAVLFGGTLAVCAAGNYFDKRKGINDGSFRSSTRLIRMLVVCLVLIDLLVLLLALLLYV